MKKRNVKLGPLVWSEFNLYRTWINRPKMMRLLDRKKRVPEVDHRKYFLGLKKDKTQKFFCVYDENTEFIGICALRKIDKKNKKAELYICLGKQGKGYGVASVHELVTYGFDRLKLRRIYLYTPEFNKTAIQCYRKAGFVKEGEFLQDLKIGNRFYNSIHMCLLSSKYRSKRR